MVIRMELGAESYDITVSRGALAHASDYMDLDRSVFILTDSGVPAAYAKTLAAQCRRAHIVTIPEGEASKNFETYGHVLGEMIRERFTRTDCAVAVGGGVVGDLCGFAAATFMRGIDFYNIPTTLLSQIDSSIGGKTAIDHGGYKNIVGAFHQPKAVLIDPDLLATLPPRQLANGMAEAVKMAATFDAELFSRIEREPLDAVIDEVIVRSLGLKKRVVEEDAHERGLRRVLNFGHTVGHGVESARAGDLFHGECVAVGMIPMSGGTARARIEAVLHRLGLPTEPGVPSAAVIEAMAHDKKKSGADITVVRVDEIGSFRFDTLPFDTLADEVRSLF